MLILYVFIGVLTNLRFLDNGGGGGDGMRGDGGGAGAGGGGGAGAGGGGAVWGGAVGYTNCMNHIL